MDIFSLSKELRPIAEKVIYDSIPVAYSEGNENALLRWIANMNQRQLDKALKLPKSRKYPLIWFVEGWDGEKQTPGYKFSGCQFYISLNSEQSKTNENREPQFDILYQIANEFIAKLKLSGIRIAENSIGWSQRANFGEGQKNKTVDVWDTVILTVDLIANSNCFKHIKN